MLAAAESEMKASIKFSLSFSAVSHRHGCPGPSFVLVASIDRRLMDRSGAENVIACTAGMYTS